MNADDIAAHLVRETEALAARLKTIRPKDKLQAAAIQLFASELAARGPDAIEDISAKLQAMVNGEDEQDLDFANTRASTAMLNAIVSAEIDDKSSARDMVMVLASLSRLLFTAI